MGAFAPPPQIILLPPSPQIKSFKVVVIMLATFSHLSPNSSIVRASHRRSEGCGFESPLGNSDIFLSKKEEVQL